ncbi:hypothetical protein H0A65_00015 [Alcaligenaceae bacterium]|nr:hypothetical protein [Alcaligenaceae bacterium]
MNTASVRKDHSEKTLLLAGAEKQDWHCQRCIQIVMKLRREGTSVEVVGLNESSATTILLRCVH